MFYIVTNWTYMLTSFIVITIINLCWKANSSLVLWVWIFDTCVNFMLLMIMMLYKHRSRADKNRDKKRKNNYCKRYYIRGNKHRISVVATKSPFKRFYPYLNRAEKSTNLVYYAFATLNDVKDNKCQFDSDSKLFGIGNRATTSVSNDIEDFVGPLKETNGTLKGIGGAIKIDGIGTLQIKLADENGIIHNILLPGSLYVKKSPIRLLCPQQWAQTARDNHPKKDGTWSGTFADRVELYWNQRRFKRTIKLDPGTNVASLYTAAGYTNYRVNEAITSSKLDFEEK